MTDFKLVRKQRRSFLKSLDQLVCWQWLECTVLARATCWTGFCWMCRTAVGSELDHLSIHVLRDSGCGLLLSLGTQRLVRRWASLSSTRKGSVAWMKMATMICAYSHWLCSWVHFSYITLWVQLMRMLCQRSALWRISPSTSASRPQRQQRTALVPTWRTTCQSSCGLCVTSVFSWWMIKTLRSLPPNT